MLWVGVLVLLMGGWEAGRVGESGEQRVLGMVAGSPLSAFPRARAPGVRKCYGRLCRCSRSGMYCRAMGRGKTAFPEPDRTPDTDVERMSLGQSFCGRVDGPALLAVFPNLRFLTFSQPCLTCISFEPAPDHLSLQHGCIKQVGTTTASSTTTRKTTALRTRRTTRTERRIPKTPQTPQSQPPSKAPSTKAKKTSTASTAPPDPRPNSTTSPRPTRRPRPTRPSTRPSRPRATRPPVPNTTPNPPAELGLFCPSIGISVLGGACCVVNSNARCSAGSTSAFPAQSGTPFERPIAEMLLLGTSCLRSVHSLDFPLFAHVFPAVSRLAFPAACLNQTLALERNQLEDYPLHLSITGIKVVLVGSGSTAIPTRDTSQAVTGTSTRRDHKSSTLSQSLTTFTRGRTPTSSTSDQYPSSSTVNQYPSHSTGDQYPSSYSTLELSSTKDSPSTSSGTRSTGGTREPTTKSSKPLLGASDDVMKVVWLALLSVVIGGAVCGWCIDRHRLWTKINQLWTHQERLGLELDEVSPPEVNFAQVQWPGTEPGAEPEGQEEPPYRSTTTTGFVLPRLSRNKRPKGRLGLGAEAGTGAAAGAEVVDPSAQGPSTSALPLVGLDNPVGPKDSTQTLASTSTQSTSVL